MMKKIIWIVILILVVIGIYKLAGKNEPVEKGEALKIGVILPLTGDFAVLGEEVKRGIEVSVEEEKKNGRQFRVFFEDDQSLSPTATVNAARKLIDIDKVDVGLTMLVEESRPIAPIFSQAKIPLLVMWDSNQSIQDSGDYLFSNGFSTEAAGETVADFAYNEIGLRNMAVVSHTDAWSEIISESFAKKFTALGGKVISSDRLSLETNDYRTTLLKIKNSNAKGIYFPLIPPSSARFLIQAEELGLKLPLFSGDALIQDVVAEAGPAAEGVYYTNYFTDQSAELSTKYKTAYNTDPIDVTLFSFGYDAVRAVVEARSRGGSIFSSLKMVYGPTRSTDRIEKLYQIRDGRSAEVTN